MLDLLIKEYLIAVIIRNFAFVFVHFLGLLYGQVEATLAQVIVFVGTSNLSSINIAYCQVI